VAIPAAVSLTGEENNYHLLAAAVILEGPDAGMFLCTGLMPDGKYVMAVVPPQHVKFLTTDSTLRAEPSHVKH
jgi:hypothetical protein